MPGELLHSCRITFLGCFALLFLAACTATTESTLVTPSPTEIVAVPTPTETAREREQMLLAFLKMLVDSPEYDPASDVLHQYLDALDIHLAGTTLSFTVQRQPDTADEFVELGADLILASVLASNSGKAGDWGLTKIKVISLGPSGSSAALYVYGHNDLVRLAQRTVSVYDIMQTRLDWGHALAEVVAPALNMRAGPGIDYPIIGTLTAGSQLKIISTSPTGDWLQVIDPSGKTGWISGKPKYTRVFGPLNEVPVVQASPTLALPTYPSGVGECIPWRDAGKHIGETTCVWGSVTSTYDSGKAFFINFSETDYSVFYGVSFDYTWSNLEGQCIILHGLIQTYKGRPEIILERTNQLEPCD